MREQNGVLTLRSVPLVETRLGSRGFWTSHPAFPSHDEREAWIGNELANGAKIIGKYPLEPFTQQKP